MTGSLFLGLVLSATSQISADSASRAAVAVEPAQARSLAELRKSFGSASRQAALTTGAEQEAAVRELITLAAETKRSTHLPQQERLRLTAQIRLRLQKVSKDIENRIAREEKVAARAKAGGKRAPAQIDTGDAAVLAQFGAAPGVPAAGFGQPGAQQPRDNGQELVDLIQRTIAPDTWDVNGGPGTIVFWPNFQALIVSAPSEVHGQLGDIIQGLRQ